MTESLNYLRLLHLADSVLPIGGFTHSFGLETLAEERRLTVAGLESFLESWLEECGAFEGRFCRLGHALASDFRAARWCRLNQELDAFKQARESREAGRALGRRLLYLVCDLAPSPALVEAAASLEDGRLAAHHAPVFGLVAGSLGVPAELAVPAFLHQSVAGLISVCQRLLPLGQARAGQLLWSLKPRMMQAAARYQEPDDDAYCFSPLVELGAMRHPYLTTRLFIS